jgi:hypothetical protein
VWGFAAAAVQAEGPCAGTAEPLLGPVDVAVIILAYLYYGPHSGEMYPLLKSNFRSQPLSQQRFRIHGRGRLGT